MSGSGTDQPARACRGFILLVVLGLLAVLFTLCVGFLSFTRSEVSSVAHLRDKADTLHLAESATDWMLAIIDARLIDATGKVRDDAFISPDLSANGCWWLREPEPGQAARMGPPDGPDMRPYTSKHEARWVYVPEDYFPQGSVRGRIAVQVADPNSRINFNDWGEDCMPSQCQLTHMLQDAACPQNTERHRGAKAGLWVAGDPKFNRCPLSPLRYGDCWCAASRSTRFPYNLDMLPDSMGGKRVTTNTISWMNATHFGGTLGTTAMEQGITPYWEWNPGYFMGPGDATWVSYVDPDTGRSPVNVNTCWNSFIRRNWDADLQWSHNLEGVFNVESLRRIVKIGKFYFRNNTQPDVIAPPDLNTMSEVEADDLYNLSEAAFFTKYPMFEPAAVIKIAPLPSYPNPPPPLDAPISIATRADAIRYLKKKVEVLKTIQAYAYQELLVRYFQASYPSKGKWLVYYPFFCSNSTYKQAYGRGYNTDLSKWVDGPLGDPANGASEVNQVKYSATSYADDVPRFPCGITLFRQHVKEDLLAIATKNNLAPAAAYKGKAYLAATKDGGERVNFDQNDTSEILPGKLDRRTASAVYDNIIPGKALLFPAEGNIEIKDPLGQLYRARMARDENAPMDEITNYYGRLNPTNTPGTLAPYLVRPQYEQSQVIPWEKGADIAGPTAPLGPWTKKNADSDVPERQLVFGPDWFSTELTTLTTTYIFVVNAQILDADSVKRDANNPRVIYNMQRYLVVEIAPDVKVEDQGEDGSATGLHYYRDALPRARKLDPNVMDKNTAVLPADNLVAGNPSTVPQDWIDYRGVAKGGESNYYSAGKQNSKRVQIRATFDLLQP